MLQYSYCEESAPKTNHPKHKRRDYLRIVSASLITVGIGVSIWALFIAPLKFPSQVEAITPAPSTSTPHTTPTTKPKPLYTTLPKVGQRIGSITLPSLKLSWPVFEGTTDSVLAKGVGHYHTSVLPGVKDNTILSGHRMTVFNRLGELKKKDLIYVKTSAGTFTYKVRSFRVVYRTSKTVIVPTKTAVLTLTTCYPFNNIGKTVKAFVVTADLVASNLATK